MSGTSTLWPWTDLNLTGVPQPALSVSATEAARRPRREKAAVIHTEDPARAALRHPPSSIHPSGRPHPPPSVRPSRRACPNTHTHTHTLSTPTRSGRRCVRRGTPGRAAKRRRPNLMFSPCVHSSTVRRVLSGARGEWWGNRPGGRAVLARWCAGCAVPRAAPWCYSAVLEAHQPAPLHACNGVPNVCRMCAECRRCDALSCDRLGAVTTWCMSSRRIS